MTRMILSRKAFASLGRSFSNDKGGRFEESEKNVKDFSKINKEHLDQGWE
jgi:hypothetical protein